MIIQFNAENGIPGQERLGAFLEYKVNNALSRFNEQIMFMEIHLSGDTEEKTRAVKIKCMLEAQVEGIDPIAVSERETTVENSVNGAIAKMKEALNKVAGHFKHY